MNLHNMQSLVVVVVVIIHVLSNKVSPIYRLERD